MRPVLSCPIVLSNRDFAESSRRRSRSKTRGSITPLNGSLHVTELFSGGLRHDHLPTELLSKMSSLSGWKMPPIRKTDGCAIPGVYYHSSAVEATQDRTMHP